MSKQVMEFLGSMRPCLFCNMHSARETLQTEQFNYKTETGDVIELSAVVPVISCDSCGESYTDDRAADIRHDAVCRYLGRLTPKNLKEVRESYGCTQAEWSELTGIGTASIKRWESGALIQGLAYDRFIRILSDKRGHLLLVQLNNYREQPIPTRRSFRTTISVATMRQASLFQLRPERLAVAGR